MTDRGLDHEQYRPPVRCHRRPRRGHYRRRSAGHDGDREHGRAAAKLPWQEASKLHLPPAPVLLSRGAGGLDGYAYAKVVEPGHLIECWARAIERVPPSRARINPRNSHSLHGRAVINPVLKVGRGTVTQSGRSNPRWRRATGDRLGLQPLTPIGQSDSLCLVTNLS